MHEVTRIIVKCDHIETLKIIAEMITLKQYNQ